MNVLYLSMKLVRKYPLLTNTEVWPLTYDLTNLWNLLRKQIFLLIAIKVCSESTVMCSLIESGDLIWCSVLLVVLRINLECLIKFVRKLNLSSAVQIILKKHCKLILKSVYGICKGKKIFYLTTQFDWKLQCGNLEHLSVKFKSSF